MEPLEIGSLKESIAEADSDVFDPDVYRETGFFVVRNVIPQGQIEAWQD